MRNVQWTSGRKWTQTFIPPHPDPTHLTAKSIICSETAGASEHKLYCHPAPPRPTNSSRCRKWVLQLCGSWVPVDSSFCRQFCLDFSRRAKLVLLFDFFSTVPFKSSGWDAWRNSFHRSPFRRTRTGLNATGWSSRERNVSRTAGQNDMSMCAWKKMPVGFRLSWHVALGIRPALILKRNVCDGVSISCQQAGARLICVFATTQHATARWVRGAWNSSRTYP